MKQTFSIAVLLTMFALAPHGAEAQTVANGTYYATPSWNMTLPASTRFVVLANFNQEAVLDRETGLVWERQPSATTTNWTTAKINCYTKSIGNRGGWRLPTMDELSSLAAGSMLPDGHPFLVSEARMYWSSNVTRPDLQSTLIFLVSPAPTNVGWGFTLWTNFDTAVGWCVRGASGDR